MPFGRATQRSYTDAQRIRYWWREERERLLATLNAVPPQRINEPVTENGWSPRNILAHRLFWEAQEREAFEQYLQNREPDLLRFPIERIAPTNAAAVQSLQTREIKSLTRALERLRSTNETLVSQIPDAHLENPNNHARILLGVALEHDREHRREIEVSFESKP